jgi:hypothetical protein
LNRIADRSGEGILRKERRRGEERIREERKREERIQEGTREELRSGMGVAYRRGDKRRIGKAGGGLWRGL